MRIQSINILSGKEKPPHFCDLINWRENFSSNFGAKIHGTLLHIKLIINKDLSYIYPMMFKVLKTVPRDLLKGGEKRKISKWSTLIIGKKAQSRREQ